ncbi:uncharacterized protein PADG_11546 [Paracoccidioides brasiliensis Pb18]|uniref:Uncharacterized protein n=1 Tax=Paracoccidioides brasiliensis (strain Pb18) TaxID=502780 RepID=A0A0A0HT24_PARBD|nr:uncharacterized protein PADG_11546 [Paracoccidioides brasiliensis Pb18]KGM92349.1 hypothetical protein PADG_11546 [Paracoccidioides brasiliensis Pb18]
MDQGQKFGHKQQKLRSNVDIIMERAKIDAITAPNLYPTLNEPISRMQIAWIPNLKSCLQWRPPLSLIQQLAAGPRGNISVTKNSPVLE